jgi:hypothetical protein
VSRMGQKLGARVVFACTLAFLLATPAVARASQIYSGSNCVFASKGTDWTLNRGGLFNRNGLFRDRARVDCPIIKERPGAAIRSASITLVDGSGFLSAYSCELVAIEVEPGRQTVQRQGATARAHVQSQPRNLSLPLFDPPTFGKVWFIGCFLPSDAGILSYTVDFR